MADEKTLEDLEEERFLKEISRAKSTAKNNFFANKQPLNKTHQAPVPTPVVRAPTSPNGTEPEWKRRQREAEQAEAVRRAEDERKKRERLNNLDTVDTTSALNQPVFVPPRQAQARGEIDTAPISPVHHSKEDLEEAERLEEERLARKLMNTVAIGAGSDNSAPVRTQSSPRTQSSAPRIHAVPQQPAFHPQQPAFHPVPNLSMPPRSEIDTSSIVRTSPRHSADEIEAALAAEEARLSKKISNTAHGPEIHAAEHHAPAQRAPSGVLKCEVIWVDKDDNSVRRQQAFPTIKGRLPLATMKRIWGVHTIIWADKGEELRAASDGYTQHVFDRPSIRVWCS